MKNFSVTSAHNGGPGARNCSHKSPIIIGNLEGDPAPNLSGQLPGVTTRRDGHGMTRTMSDMYVHTVDCIQNIVEVFNTTTLARTTYDLTSANGKGQGVGPCEAAPVIYAVYGRVIKVYTFIQ